MAFLELLDGRLQSAAVGEPASVPVRQAALAALRHQLVDVLRRPLLDIEWSEVPGGWELVAMEGTGRVVLVVIREEIDAAGLMAALARQADLARLSRDDVARRYVGGAQGLAQDYGQMRRLLPATLTPGPSVTVIAASYARDVRGSEAFLAQAGVSLYGVEVRELEQAHGAPSRVLLEVLALRESAHALSGPVLVERGPGRRGRRRLINAHDVGPGSHAGTGAAYPAPAGTAPAGSVPAARSGEPAPAPVADTVPTAMSAPSATSAPSAPSVSSVTTAPVPHVMTSHRSAAPVLGARMTVPIGEESVRALAQAAARLDGPAPLVWRSLRRGLDFRATLATDGRIHLADGRVVDDPSVAASLVRGDDTVGDVDGWRVWKLGVGGPALATLLA